MAVILHKARFGVSYLCFYACKGRYVSIARTIHHKLRVNAKNAVVTRQKHRRNTPILYLRTAHNRPGSKIDISLPKHPVIQHRFSRTIARIRKIRRHRMSKALDLSHLFSKKRIPVSIIEECNATHGTRSTWMREKLGKENIRTAFCRRKGGLYASRACTSDKHTRTP